MWSLKAVQDKNMKTNKIQQLIFPATIETELIFHWKLTFTVELKLYLLFF